MNKRKKKILVVGEASWLPTGFSNYYGELIPRLHATGKYEIAEIGSYARRDDPNVNDFIRGRWKFYGVMPTNQEELKAFQQPSQHPRDKGQNINQFGAGVFDYAMADFQPDIVCVPPGELVLTQEGYRPIQDIKVGEKVVTHKGRLKPVKKVMKRQHIGKIYNVKFEGCSDPIKVTGEHPVLVRSNGQESLRLKNYTYKVETTTTSWLKRVLHLLIRLSEIH